MAYADEMIKQLEDENKRLRLIIAATSNSFTGNECLIGDVIADAGGNKWILGADSCWHCYDRCD